MASYSVMTSMRKKTFLWMTVVGIEIVDAGSEVDRSGGLYQPFFAVTPTKCYKGEGFIHSE